MARGWHGDSAGHAKAGQLGGRRSAANRRRSQFGEQLGVAPKIPARKPRGAEKPQGSPTT
jgi:hypothetical protein